MATCVVTLQPSIAYLDPSTPEKSNISASQSREYFRLLLPVLLTYFKEHHVHRKSDINARCGHKLPVHANDSSHETQMVGHSGGASAGGEQF